MANTIVDVKMNKNLKAETLKVGKGDKDGVTINLALKARTA